MAQVVFPALRVALVAGLLLAACGGDDGREKTSLVELLRPERVVVLGELHGTNEHPAAIVDAAAAYDGPLWIGLEMPAGEQGRLDAYLASDGGESARADLLTGQFWTYDDGRASVAMLELIDGIRSLRAGGADVELAAFDVDVMESATARDAGMADAIEAANDGDRAVLVLVGSVHALIGEPEFEIEPGYVPMAKALVDRGVDVVSLQGVSGGGEAWNCISEGCGVHASGGEDRGDEAFVATSDEPVDGYHGILYVPMISAAVPARS
jgi:hypothetical protein